MASPNRTEGGPFDVLVTPFVNKSLNPFIHGRISPPTYKSRSRNPKTSIVFKLLRLHLLMLTSHLWPPIRNQSLLLPIQSLPLTFSNTDKAPSDWTDCEASIIMDKIKNKQSMAMPTPFRTYFSSDQGFVRKHKALSRKLITLQS